MSQAWAGSDSRLLWLPFWSWVQHRWWLPVEWLLSASPALRWSTVSVTVSGDAACGRWGKPSAFPSGRENEIQCGKEHRRNALELGTPSCAVIFCLHVRTASDGDRGCGSAPGPMAPVQNPSADGRFW